MGNSIHSCSIVKCRNCAHLYTLSISDVEVKHLYEGGDYKVVENRGSIFDCILDIEYSFILRKLESLYPSKGYLLDFGCGKGKFLWLATKLGWQVKGVEIGESRAKYAKEIYKLDINTEVYSKGPIEPHRFDIITMFHVCEHLDKPKVMVSELVRSNLKNDALILIEVPNFFSIQSRISGKKWLHLDVPRHVSHFTQNSVEELIESIGCHPIKCEYFSFHLGVLGMVQSLLSLMGYNKNIIYQLKYKKTIRELFLILALTPVSFILELIAAIFKKGGIIRVYAIRK